MRWCCGLGNMIRHGHASADTLAVFGNLISCTGVSDILGCLTECGNGDVGVEDWLDGCSRRKTALVLGI